MKNNTMKTIVLMVSKVFPAYHPRKGEPTNFKEKILSGDKIHTIRGNYDLWEKRSRLINSDHGILSLREWECKPYRSKQVEFDVRIGISVQKLEFEDEDLCSLNIKGEALDLYTVAKNDGLRIKEFSDWFKPYDLSKPMAIIHFTGMRY